MVYNYTRPRAPVAASEKGPGPSYALPTLTGHAEHDPRSVHARGPAYQFGSALGSPPGPCSPGPCHLPDSKILRYGREGGRSYTIYPRIAELKRFSVPAPGTYGSSPPALTKTRAPAYSFGIICPPITGDKTPGPNTYTTIGAFGRSVESVKRQSPAYSIYSRSKTGGFDEDFCKTPGPGTYLTVSTNSYKKRRPQYSLTGRNEPPGDTTQKPGPGAHCPEAVIVNKRISPRYSFGIRHSEYEAPLIVSGVD